jgi:hypothetical protein
LVQEHQAVPMAVVIEGQIQFFLRLLQSGVAVAVALIKIHQLELIHKQVEDPVVVAEVQTRRQ